MTKTSGPAYATFSVITPLPSSTVSARVGPFAPGDSVVVTYTVENTGNLPATVSSLGATVSPPGNGFTASNGAVPPTLSPGASFSSTIKITFSSGLGDSYEGLTATISLQIYGVGTTTACTSTFTHTSTITQTVVKTITTTKTVTTINTVTVTVTKTTTKTAYELPGEAALWATSSCVSATITTTVTATHTSTTTITQTTTVTVTTTVSKTTTTTKTTTCPWHGCH